MKEVLRWLNRNHVTINAFLTVAMILVTIALIFVSCSSIDVSKKIGKIELSLALDRQRSLILEDIQLTDDIISEADLNHLIIKTEINNYNNSINGSSIKAGYESMFISNFALTSGRSQLAMDSKSFGNSTIKSALNNYILLITGLKIKQEQILQALQNGNQKVQIENIHAFISAGKILVGEEDIEENIKNVKLLLNNYRYELNQSLENNLRESNNVSDFFK